MVKESQSRIGDWTSDGTLPGSPPQIVMMLNAQSRILWLNRQRADSSFDSATAAGGMDVHDLLHRGCSGDCSWSGLWDHSWSRLATRDVQEWEIDDSYLNKVLRCHLVRSPNANGEEERRSARALLTVKDITGFRRAHESLMGQRNELSQRLMEQNASLSESREQLLNECEDHNLAREKLHGSRQQLRLLARELNNAQENERRRIALDLHDGIAQRLGVAKYYLETISGQLADKSCEQQSEMLNVVIIQVKNTMEELRRISRNLSPIELEGRGIEPALEILCKEFESQIGNIALNCDIGVSNRDVPDLITTAIYRVVQEAMQNISKHASANSVEVNLAWSDNGIKLKITDDGRGFGVEERQEKGSALSGSGLGNMQERVESSAGNFEITSRSGGGTCIAAWWNEEVLLLLGSDEAVGDRIGSDSRHVV